jgi:hypothetical protein
MTSGGIFNSLPMSVIPLLGERYHAARVSEGMTNNLAADRFQEWRFNDDQLPGQMPLFITRRERWQFVVCPV